MSSAVFSLLMRLGRLAYWCCVDFMVNLADLTGTSYPEANTWVTWVLLLLIPGLLLLLLLVRAWQRRRLRQRRIR